PALSAGQGCFDLSGFAECGEHVSCVAGLTGTTFDGARNGGIAVVSQLVQPVVDLDNTPKESNVQVDALGDGGRRVDHRGVDRRQRTPQRAESAMVAEAATEPSLCRPCGGEPWTPTWDGVANEDQRDAQTGDRGSVHAPLPQLGLDLATDDGDEAHGAVGGGKQHSGRDDPVPAA